MSPLRVGATVIVAGAGVVALSGLFSAIGSLASEKSDMGIAAGAVTVVVCVAVAAAAVTHFYNRSKKEGPK